ncbi:MAG TPA: TonB-dependent receptor [Cyclobacteriaceae bacterium]|nr:TonB-dependent receptor [Cyclobacteriaceae bacterium]HRJ83462.1 TonB-dependent receptor [Cyclobacteriaceae bacterium]
MNQTLRLFNRIPILVLLMLLISVTGLFGQTRSVSGVVKSEGETLPGVSVTEKGTSNGTVTDSNGKFSISVSTNSTLVFSFVGMAPQEVVVGSQTNFDVELLPDISQLEEVVVVGYGTVKKSDVTGSIVSIGGDDLKKMPVATVAESLTGRLAGVQVTSTEGSPDAEINIRVRGGTSLSQDNNPLYMVDGFPVNSISDISPSDIETITVLKDASSTAIYGSRGANGVVIITTKGGTTDGKISVSYNTFAGFKRIAKTLDVLSPQDYVKWQYEYAMLRNNITSYENFFGPYQDIDLYTGLNGNDWQRQIYGRTGKVFSNDLSVRGGTDKFNYSINYARFQEKAIMIGSDFVRDNITVRLNNKPNNKINIGFSLRYSNTEINGGGANEQNEVSSADSRLKHSVGYSPIPIPGITTDANDTDDQTAGDLVNPIAATYDNNRYQERRNFNIGGSFSWNIIDNLQLKIEGGIDTYNYLDNRFYGLTTYFVANRPASENQNHPAVILRDRKEFRLRNTNTLSYNFKDILPSDHQVNVMVGHEVLTKEVNRVTSEIHGFPDFFKSEQAFRLTTQGVPVSVDNYFDPDEKLLSFFTRANYSFKNRYLLEAVYRADGSSKFLGDNVWGFFPSVSGAWKVSEEDFMRGIADMVSNVKLRASFGVAGNNNIPVGQTLTMFESRTNTWMSGFDNFWAASNIMANPDLKWETTYTQNIGLDFSILKGRISATVEYYKNNTKDLLLEFPTPGTGYASQFRNIGETENKGIDLSLTYVAIDRKDYGLTFSFNTNINQNRIVSLGELEAITAGTNSNWASTMIGRDYDVRVGRSLGAMFGYVNDGRYEVSDFEGYDETTGRWILKAGVADASGIVGPGLNNARPGMMKLKDMDGNGVVNLDDQRVIGSFLPKHSGGFVINGYAYGFDLTAAFNYSYGNDVYNANKIEFTTANPNTQYRNLIDIMAEGQRWTNINAAGQLVNDPTELAALNANTTMWSPYMNRFVFSDWAVEDGSFLRLNTLTLGYTLPAGLASRVKLRNMRFYATGYNVFLISNYSGFDPEVSTRRRTPYTPGVDYSAYPRSRQIVFGLNFNF